MRTVRQREVNPVSAQAFRAMTPPFLRALAGRGQGSGREVNSTRKTGQRRSPPLDEAVTTTEAIGVDPEWVEAWAFAWLAEQTLAGQPGNVPAVTGARGARVLGGIFPA